MTLKIDQSAEPARKIRNYWDWKVWIEGSEDELDEIRLVRYQLHRTFPDPTRETTDRASKFALATSGWGEFTIYAAVEFKNPRRKSKRLTHWLRLAGSPKDPAPLYSIGSSEPSVFLSSSFADVHLAHDIAEALRAQRVPVTGSNETSLPGVDWAFSRAAKLEEADVAVVIVGERIGESLTREVQELIKLKKPIIPVVLSESVPAPLSAYEAIRVKPGVDAGDIANRIVAVLPKISR
jgi:hypothetical protein